MDKPMASSSPWSVSLFVDSVIGASIDLAHVIS